MTDVDKILLGVLGGIGLWFFMKKSKASVNVTPAPTFISTASEVGDGTFSPTFSIVDIKSSSFVILTGFNAGVTFDVSLDGGNTYPFHSLSSKSQLISGLKSKTTYQVVRRMYGTINTSPLVIFPAAPVTTL